MSRRYIFSSESVGEGHPDKVCDAISDAVLDACIEQDRRSRVACETFAKSNMVLVGGEITIPSLSEDQPLTSVLHVEQLVRDTVRDIGYVNDDDVFHADQISITNIITKQSPDIAQGVDARAVEGKDTAEQGAGDQGIDVRLRMRRNAGAHARRPSCLRIGSGANSPVFARTESRLVAARREIAGFSDLRKRQTYWHFVCGVSTQHTRDVKHSELPQFRDRGR
jgi:hypothetical protein